MESNKETRLMVSLSLATFRQVDIVGEHWEVIPEGIVGDTRDKSRKVLASDDSLEDDSCLASMGCSSHYRRLSVMEEEAHS
jgi:hypothetical protein